MQRYALIGAAGYIAPRHLEAIKATGGTLDCAYDVNDSVGILDRYFPEAKFFTSFEAFEDHVLSGQNAITRVSICSPNHLHKAHIAFGLRAGADVICEKPLVLTRQELDALSLLEQQTGKHVYTILQLRLHPSIIALRDRMRQSSAGGTHEVDLGYFTSRGPWYHASWKGSESKSGGIATNIGVHFFDMLGFVFGALEQNVLHHRSEDCAAGYLEFERARVRWFLSINRAHLPPQTPEGQSTYRSITVDGQEVEFSGGFTELHTTSYAELDSGRGFGLSAARPSIEIVSALCDMPVTSEAGRLHADLVRIRGAS